ARPRGTPPTGRGGSGCRRSRPRCELRAPARPAAPAALPRRRGRGTGPLRPPPRRRTPRLLRTTVPPRRGHSSLVVPPLAELVIGLRLRNLSLFLLRRQRAAIGPQHLELTSGVRRLRRANHPANEPCAALTNPRGSARPCLPCSGHGCRSWSY